MRFPNAQAGVKKIFTAQILSLISSICTIIVAIGVLVAAGAALAALAAGSEETMIAAVGAGALSIIFGIAAGVLSIIGFILLLVGLAKAQKDDENFHYAFFAAIAGIILAIGTTIFTNSIVANTILNFLASISGVVVMFFSLRGIQAIADKLGATDLGDKAQKIMNMIVGAYALGAIIECVAGFLKLSVTAMTIAGILGIVAAIVEIIALFMYIGLLKKAKEAFKAE